MKGHSEKTNVMRILDANNINYRSERYDCEELNGSAVARLIGEDSARVFKTLVLKGERHGHLVCCIPVDEELDLKKVARASNDKRVEMLPLKDLTAVTGYIRGGCSPIGMKKPLPTFFHESATNGEYIALSAGKRGCQIVLSPNDVIALTNATLADLIKS